MISGSIEGVAKASELLKTRGAKRCIPLQVSAPFHCSMLKPAGLNLAKDLEKIEFHDPKIPYIANVDVQTVTKSDQIRSRLVEQVWSPVRWTQTLQKIIREYPTIQPIEVGPGRVVAGHLKKVNESVTTLTTDTLENLTKVTETE